MLMKLTTVFMAAALVTVICLSGAAVLGLFDADEHTIQHLVYTDDYPILLADELATILGDYSVGETVERHVEVKSARAGTIRIPLTSTSGRLPTQTHAGRKWSVCSTIGKACIISSCNGLRTR